MTENFELLDIGQIEIMHQQTHDRIDADGETDCDMLRITHDSLAAELVKRGLPHNTEVVCPEVITNAPNYRRGFTDDICTQCAFGQLFPFCNLYKFDYVKGYTCDSFRYFEVLILEPPHGFLMANGKQTAYAATKEIDSSKPHLIVSDGEVFGIATFKDPAQMKSKEFDSENWLGQHRVTARERRQWWPDLDLFYVYRLDEWHPYEGVKLYEDKKVINEPKLTASQWQLISKSKELPKQITLIDEAVLINEDQTFIMDKDLYNQGDEKGMDFLLDTLKATYNLDADTVIPDSYDATKEVIPIYSLALVRNPRMRVSKKNAIIKNDEKIILDVSSGYAEIHHLSSLAGATLVQDIKQEEGDMPFGIVRRESEFCVVNTDTEEVMGCHNSEAEADDQLTALNINVDEDKAGHRDKPKKKKPKKEKEQKEAGFMANLRILGKNISAFLSMAESEETEDKMFQTAAGFAQKTTLDGEVWHFTWSTNAFEDREGEIFSTKSLKDYVESNEINDNKGYFNLWHINEEDGHFNTDFARKEWQGVIGRFLVEAGPYLDNHKGQSAKKFLAEFAGGHPEIAPEGWGCSPEYKYLPEERATKVYKTIWITRTSTLPRMDAANIWTDTRQLARSKNMSESEKDLTEKQMKAALAFFGDTETENMVAEGNQKTAELEAALVNHKSKENADAEKAETENAASITFDQVQFELLAQEVGKQFSINNEPLIEALTSMAETQKAITERLEKLELQGDAKAKAETPKYTFNLQRASEAEETIVADGDKLKDEKPAEQSTTSGDQAMITPEQFFGRN